MMNGKSPYMSERSNAGTKVHIQQDPPAVSEGSVRVMRLKPYGGDPC